MTIAKRKASDVFGHNQSRPGCLLFPSNLPPPPTIQLPLPPFYMIFDNSSVWLAGSQLDPSFHLPLTIQPPFPLFTELLSSLMFCKGGHWMGAFPLSKNSKPLLHIWIVFSLGFWSFVLVPFMINFYLGCQIFCEKGWRHLGQSGERPTQVGSNVGTVGL